jgi:hypothetical protein
MREQAQNDIAMAAGPQGARMGVQPVPMSNSNIVAPQAPKKVVNFNDLP